MFFTQVSVYKYRDDILAKKLSFKHHIEFNKKRFITETRAVNPLVGEIHFYK